jgi:hypothetical protein
MGPRWSGYAEGESAVILFCLLSGGRSECLLLVDTYFTHPVSGQYFADCYPRQRTAVRILVTSPLTIILMFWLSADPWRTVQDSGPDFGHSYRTAVRILVTSPLTIIILMFWLSADPWRTVQDSGPDFSHFSSVLTSCRPGPTKTVLLKLKLKKKP